MVINKFNRIIKNKWIWGVFAILISAFFAFDFLFTGGDSDRSSSRMAGTLAAKDVSVSAFDDVRNDVRGRGRAYDRDTPQHVINERTWEQLAALAVAEENHLVANDAEVRDAILQERAFKDQSGQFNLRAYELILRENGFTPEGFEAQQKRRITLAKLMRAVLGSAAWVSPMELEGAIDDVTDKFTVKIASFVDRDAAKVKLDDAGLKAYYAEHTNSIALPDLMKVRYVRYQADAPARLAQFKITDEELHDHYDAVSSRFETQTTNGVVTKKFEEVKGILEHELKVIASVEAYRTNLLFRAYPADAAMAAAFSNRLDRIAAEDKAKIVTSPFFAAESSRFVRGFMSRVESIAPGVQGFAAQAAELDPESEDLRYGVVAGSNVVYLLERAAFVKAHVPTFEEAKTAIRGDALRDAQNKAFKAAVEKKRALAAALVAKGGAFDAKAIGADSVSTSIVFSVTGLTRETPSDVRYVSSSARKLSKGQLSEFVATANPSRALLVYCEDRVAGDAAAAQMVRAQLRDELSYAAAASVPAAWSKWNLARMGFEANDAFSVKPADESDVSED